MQAEGRPDSIRSMEHEECLRRLAADELGRLAVIAGHAPLIVPVNYVLDGETIVFRSDPGTKLAAAGRAAACFEIDHFDREERAGWSVIAVGRLEEVTRWDAVTLRHVQSLPIDPWAGGEKAHWLRLVPDRITGRVVGRPPRTDGPRPAR